MDTIAFHNTRRIASGPLREAALAAREVLERDPGAHVLLFDADTSRRIELDFRGDVEDLLERVDAIERRLTAGLTPEQESVLRDWLAAVARDLLPRPQRIAADRLVYSPVTPC